MDNEISKLFTDLDNLYEEFKNKKAQDNFSEIPISSETIELTRKVLSTFEVWGYFITTEEIPLNREKKVYVSLGYELDGSATIEWFFNIDDMLSVSINNELILDKKQEKFCWVYIKKGDLVGEKGSLQEFIISLLRFLQ